MTRTGLALALLLALAPVALSLVAGSPTLRAQAPDDPRALAGQPVLALASHPAVTLTLRQTSGGRQSALARMVRAPGPGLRLTPDGQFIYGWGCGEAGCATDGVFLAYDAAREQVFAVLYGDGQQLLWVPPRASPWPAALADPLRTFSPEIVRRMHFAAG